MALNINDTEARRQYTATAGQTVFAVPFTFFEASELKVYNGDTLLTYDDTPDNATEYSVTGADSDLGGSITLGAPGATLNDVITIVHEVPVERITDFPLSGPFQIESLNEELSKIVAMIRQQRTIMDRKIGLSDTDTTTIPGSLPEKADRAGKYLAFDGNGDPAASSGTGADAGLRTDLAASGGSALVSFLQSGTGVVSRTVQAKLRDAISVKDFGAVGDNSTNDTAAFAAAIDYIESAGFPVYVPPGTYLTDPFQISPTAYNAQAFFFGDEDASTVIKRRTTGAGAFVTIGDAAAVIFQANLFIGGITIDGGATTNGPACLMYDVVRSQIEGCTFKGGSYALHSLGGIANTFDHCKFQDAQRGVQIEKFTSAAGGGWPNILRFNNCHFVDNTKYGVWFDDGRMLVLDGCQVEGNGTTLAASEGGVYVGADIGTEVTVTDPESIGLIVKDTWFEANRGIADIYLNSGLNSVENSNFFSQSTMVTNDIRIDGGRYRFKNLNMSFGKTANVLENSGTSTGNLLEFVQAAALSYNSGKTMVVGGFFALLGNGAVPGINGATAPLIQLGSDSTGANPTITFSQAFKAATTPKVFVSAVDSGTGFTEAPRVYDVTNTGFKITKARSTAGVESTSNYQVDWVAFGENP